MKTSATSKVIAAERRELAANAQRTLLKSGGRDSLARQVVANVGALLPGGGES